MVVTLAVVTAVDVSCASIFVIVEYSRQNLRHCSQEVGLAKPAAVKNKVTLIKVVPSRFLFRAMSTSCQCAVWSSGMPTQQNCALVPNFGGTEVTGVGVTERPATSHC